MTTHTPGPWVVSFPHIVAKDARETLVCEVTGTASNDAAQADARLIAAAPDLLAVLASCVFAIEIVQRQERERGDKSADAWDHVLKPARAALAKAEGEP